MGELDVRLEKVLQQYQRAISHDRPRPNDDKLMLILLEAMIQTRKELAALRAISEGG